MRRLELRQEAEVEIFNAALRYERERRNLASDSSPRWMPRSAAPQKALSSFRRSSPAFVVHWFESFLMAYSSSSRSPWSL